MTDPNLTHIYMLRDRSGSMLDIKRQTDSGFDEFIAVQKAADGECRVTLVDFDHDYEIVFSNLPVDEVPKSNLQPRGSTALHDSLGKFITDTGRELRALPEDERPGSVVFVVLTDGMQNASLGGSWAWNPTMVSDSGINEFGFKHYTARELKKMIKHQQDAYSWNFYFLGANQDAILVGGELGFLGSNSLTYSGANTNIAMAAVGNSVVTYRGAMTKGASYGAAVASATFTDEDRTAATE